MEVGKKIQKLRQERGLTQEQFAAQLFVSRTAVSKWETGRGTPNIESLKMIAEKFGVTLDELLRAEEAIAVCESGHRENIRRLTGRMEAVLNLSSFLLLILPLYKAKSDGQFVSVPLYLFDGRFSFVFWLFPVILIICGAAELMTGCEKSRRLIGYAGMMINAVMVIFMILCGQPYPGTLYFIYILIRIMFFHKLNR